MKVCFKCKVEKDESEFCKHKQSKDGLNCRCKQCASQYYQENKHKYVERKAAYELNNREKILAQKREYVKAHKSEKTAYDKVYREENKEKIAQYKKDWETKCRHETEFKLKRNLRRRVHHALMGNSKSAHTMELIGCTIEEFKLHIEAQFQEGMSWDNYSPEGWHIDHIIPCYAFDLTKPEHQRKCFHYSNQRPLWAVDNLTRPRTVYDTTNLEISQADVDSFQTSSTSVILSENDTASVWAILCSEATTDPEINSFSQSAL